MKAGGRRRWVTFRLMRELAAALKARFPALQEDSAAHRAEHAAEVELPFLLLRQPELRFVPIALGTGQFEVLEQLGKALADVDCGAARIPFLLWPRAT